MELTGFVDGSARAGTAEAWDNINPATGLPIASCRAFSDADVDAAVASAQRGFEVWSQTTAAERGKVLRRAADLLVQRNDELARLEVQDTGKPLQEALVVDVASGADCLNFFAGAAAAFNGAHIPLKNAFAYTRREPLGVCAGIGAWNYPIQIACWKSAPALAAGNAMVFKPSELTPMTALKLAEIYAEAGLPPGVFNVCRGQGPPAPRWPRTPGWPRCRSPGRCPPASGS